MNNHRGLLQQYFKEAGIKEFGAEISVEIGLYLTSFADWLDSQEAAQPSVEGDGANGANCDACPVANKAGCYICCSKPPRASA
jgi:hypothetical protein